MAAKKSGLAESMFLGAIGFLRPLLGPEGMCIFAPYTCTLYAADQLRHQPLHVALWRITGRLIACNPINGLWRWWHHKT